MVRKNFPNLRNLRNSYNLILLQSLKTRYKLFLYFKKNQNNFKKQLATCNYYPLFRQVVKSQFLVKKIFLKIYKGKTFFLSAK